MTDLARMANDRERPTQSDDYDERSNEFLAFQTSTKVRGYGTAYAYFSRNLPEAFAMLTDPVRETEADFGALTIRTLDQGRQVIVVEAPVALKDRGIQRTLAFPIGVLNRFYR